MNEGTSDDSLDVDIVERALAILNEESRAWVTWLQRLSESVEGDSDA